MTNEDITARKEEAEPWLIDQRSFYPLDGQAIITENLAALKEKQAMLSLVTAQGKVYSDVLMIGVDEEKIQIDKPVDWDENGDAFRIFYRDSSNYWCFFYSLNISTGPFSISLDLPGRLFYLQRRRGKRITAPAGTRAMAKKSGNYLMQTVYVMDISATGMLFCDGVPPEEYPVDSVINDIVISVPHPRENKDDTSSGVHKMSPLIRKGRVIRSFVDSKTRRSCYGVSFECDSVYVKENLCRMISEIALCA